MSSSSGSVDPVIDLDDLIKALSAQITETGWVEEEIARKQAAGEPLVNVFELAAAVKAEEEEAKAKAKAAAAAAAEAEAQAKVKAEAEVR